LQAVTIASRHDTALSTSGSGSELIWTASAVAVERTADLGVAAVVAASSAAESRR
jgi:hypothetical protein